ncbi:response regulator transcription factor [Lactiplantibacillus fabifermentans]|uniref:Winged helix family two component transcriptional regulator n=2 Tax=Lactiplantibacillus fabifermentans TaxID=483011 RepID=A0A0R2NZV6_9LACO|nr:response regulator transcription factor [Lactiplantibacillus fabifermentans]ETY74341.1 PhoB family transcriptional regulator [Lactiplantibacillus fabifermentans T30PCM01]KRO28298.1 winged helix family two component transcriptional regulator [Lactiplantibacillus fabifermentans DSM 21115]
MTKILLVDDEESVVDFLQQELTFEDYEVVTAGDGQAAYEIYEAQKDDLDLIILDWMLPKMDGLEVLRRIRKHDDIPVIMMTARDYVGDKVAGLDGGADDYITKPFDTEELLARIRVILRHSEQNQATPQIYQYADLELDTKARQVHRNRRLVQLTQREYELLLTLMQHAGDTLTRDELLDQVWGVDFEGQPNIVDVYVRYLRHKVDTESDRKLIHTVRGVGYCLRDDVHA